MNYHILNENEDIIASFKHKTDRDICLERFSDIFSDCEFFSTTQKSYVYFEKEINDGR